LEITEEGFAFTVAVVAAIGHDEVDVTDDEIKEGAGVVFSSCVGWVVPVLGEDLEVFWLPFWSEGEGAAFVIIVGEIVIIPDGINWSGAGEGAPCGVKLAAVVVDALFVLSLWVVDVEVVP